MASDKKMLPCPKCGLTDHLAVYEYDGAFYVECDNGFNSAPTPPAKKPCMYRSAAATSVRYAIKLHNDEVSGKLVS
jgi:Zn ribbon nucleic-acid-binding protein